MVVLDSSGGRTPLAGVPVHLAGEAGGVVTDEDGRYAVEATGAARRHVAVNDGWDGVPALPYTRWVHEVDLTPGPVGVPETVLRPLVPAEPVGSIAPDEDYLVVLGGTVQVTIPAGAMSQAPEVSGRVLNRDHHWPDPPDAVAFGLAVRVSGGYEGPLGVRFPNDLGLPPGYEMDLYGLTPDGWELGDVGVVSADGTWFEAVLPHPGDFVAVAWFEQTSWAPVSAVDLTGIGGELRETDVRADGSVRVLGRGAGVGATFLVRCVEPEGGPCRSVALEYHSLAADPGVLLAAGLVLDSAVPETVRVTMRLAGLARTVDFVASAGAGYFPAFVRQRYANLPEAGPPPTGVHPYTIEVNPLWPAVYEGTEVPTRDPRGWAQRFHGSAGFVNLRDSPYGAGWSVSGLKRLVSDPPGRRFLVVDGSRHVIPRSVVRRVTGVGPTGLAAPDCMGQPATSCVAGPMAVAYTPEPEMGMVFAMGPDASGVHTFYVVDAVGGYGQMANGRVVRRAAVNLSGMTPEMP